LAEESTAKPGHGNRFGQAGLAEPSANGSAGLQVMVSARHGGVTVRYRDVGEPRTFARHVDSSLLRPLRE